MNLDGRPEAHSCLWPVPQILTMLLRRRLLLTLPQLGFGLVILLSQLPILYRSVFDYQLVFILNVVTGQLNRN